MNQLADLKAQRERLCLLPGYRLLQLYHSGEIGWPECQYAINHNRYYEIHARITGRTGRSTDTG